jgi:hypothetical protein
MSPQLKNYYIYGSFKDCQTLVEDFNFCFKTKSMTAEDAHVQFSLTLREIIARESLRYNKKLRERPSLQVWEVIFIDSVEGHSQTIMNYLLS